MINPGFVLERLMDYYRDGFEIAAPYVIDDTIYDTYAYITSGHSYEHAFLRNTLTLTKGDLNRFKEQIKEFVEPELVCAGTKMPPRDHLYTNITGVFIAEEPIPEDVKKEIRKFKYYKGYGFFRHGYVQARVAAFDTATGELICNHAAKNLMSEYERVLG